MNERIKQLAEQADKLADEHTKAFTDGTGEWKHSWNEVYDEKFAELIVRECCFVGEQYAEGLFDMKHYDFVNKKIREHFGVQEWKQYG